MNTDAPQYSVVVPVYHGQHTLLPLTQQLSHFFDTHALSYELIFVYDCGPDNSWQVLKEIKAKQPDVVTLVRLAANAGQHQATLCGFTFARSRYILTLDEDLQHPPEEIEKLIATQQAGNYQLVYGIYATSRHSRLRNLASGCFNWLITRLVPHLYPRFTSFRLIDTNIAKQAANLPPTYPFVDGMIARLKPHTGTCTVFHTANTQYRKSTYTWFKLAKHALGIITYYTRIPLYIGIVGLTGILLLWYLPVNWNAHTCLLNITWAKAILLCIISLLLIFWKRQKRTKGYDIAEVV